jgi:large subunit ribosomal protein L16
MIQPRTSKYVKSQKRSKMMASTSNISELCFGNYAIKSISNGYISSKNLLAFKQLFSKHLKRGGKVNLKVFPNIAKTRKPPEVRMGRGKGNFDRWVTKISKGQLLFEISSNAIPSAVRQIFKILVKQSPIDVKLICYTYL